MSDFATMRRPLPFYGSWASFSRALKALKEHGIPERISVRSLTPILKDEASRVSTGFAAMGWVDDRDIATAPLRALVSSFGEPSWQSTLADVVPKTYSFVPGNWADITAEELHSAFLAYSGRDVAVMSSAETFFLVLAHQAGFALTEKLYRRAVRAISDAKTKSRAPNNAPNQDIDLVEDFVEVHDSVLRSELIKKPPAKLPNKSSRDTSHKEIEWVDIILKLSTLIGDSKLTDEERKSLGSTISVLGRQISSA